MIDPSPRPALDDAAIAAVFEQAAHQLATIAGAQHIRVLIAWPNRSVTIEVSHSGWSELGRLSDPAGRFWWVVLWHAERGEGRLLRYFRKAKRGVMGEIAPPDHQ